MKYIFPELLIRLLNDSTEEISQKDILLQKKILLAEFELNTKPFIEINGVSFNKNDVIQMFDSFNFEHLPFHLAIAKNEALRLFLEEQKLAPLHTVNFDNAIFYTDEFKSFISVYLSDDISEKIYEALYKQEATKLKTLLSFTMLLDQPSLVKSYEHIYKALQKIIKQIENYTQDITSKKVKVNKEDLYRKFFNQEFIEVLNLLPDEFAIKRDETIESLLNLIDSISGFRFHQNIVVRAVLLLKGIALYFPFEKHLRYPLLKAQCSEALKKRIDGSFFLFKTAYQDPHLFTKRGISIILSLLSFVEFLLIGFIFMVFIFFEQLFKLPSSISKLLFGDSSMSKIVGYILFLLFVICLFILYIR